MSGPKFFFSSIVVTAIYFAGYLLVVGGIWTALLSAAALMLALQVVYFIFVCIFAWTEVRRAAASLERQQRSATPDHKPASSKLNQHLGGTN